MMPALATLALATFVARLVIREHWREMRATEALLVADMRAEGAAQVAAFVLSETDRLRAEDEMWRRIQQAVDAAAFDRMPDQIRALPETSEEIR